MYKNTQNVYFLQKHTIYSKKELEKLSIECSGEKLSVESLELSAVESR